MALIILNASTKNKSTTNRTPSYCTVQPVPAPVFPYKKSKLLKEDQAPIQQDAQLKQDQGSKDDDRDKASSITPAQKEAQLQQLRCLIDKHLHKHDHKWNTLLAQKDTNTYFNIFSQCVEKAAIEYAHIDK